MDVELLERLGLVSFDFGDLRLVFYRIDLLLVEL